MQTDIQNYKILKIYESASKLRTARLGFLTKLKQFLEMDPLTPKRKLRCENQL